MFNYTKHNLSHVCCMDSGQGWYHMATINAASIFAIGGLFVQIPH